MLKNTTNPSSSSSFPPPTHSSSSSSSAPAREDARESWSSRHLLNRDAGECRVRGSRDGRFRGHRKFQQHRTLHVVFLRHRKRRRETSISVVVAWGLESCDCGS
ncbi:hypothetical protein AAHE18_14G184400 [Arachis hypogaea]|nr:uncharacterized protein DS421_14g474360 [Arachis hypogaea]